MKHRDRDRELATDYLTGELDADERARAQRRMDEDPAFRAEVARLRPIVEQLGELPLQAWPVAEPAPTRPRRVAPRSLALAGLAAVLLLVGGTAGWLVRGGSDNVTATGPVVPLTAVGRAPLDSHGRAVMARSARMLITVSRLPVPRPGEYYEAWLLNSPRDLVPVASFRVSSTGSARLVVSLPVNAQRFRFIDVSVQRASAGPAHSGDSFLRGRLPTA